eukprot:g74239.t1
MATETPLKDVTNAPDENEMTADKEQQSMASVVGRLDSIKADLAGLAGRLSKAASNMATAENSLLQSGDKGDTVLTAELQAKVESLQASLKQAAAERVTEVTIAEHRHLQEIASLKQRHEQEVEKLQAEITALKLQLQEIKFDMANQKAQAVAAAADAQALADLNASLAAMAKAAMAKVAQTAEQAIQTAEPKEGEEVTMEEEEHRASSEPEEGLSAQPAGESEQDAAEPASEEAEQNAAELAPLPPPTAEEETLLAMQVEGSGEEAQAVVEEAEEKSGQSNTTAACTTTAKGEEEDDDSMQELGEQGETAALVEEEPGLGQEDQEQEPTRPSKRPKTAKAQEEKEEEREQQSAAAAPARPVGFVGKVSKNTVAQIKDIRKALKDLDPDWNKRSQAMIKLEKMVKEEGVMLMEGWKAQEEKLREPLAVQSTDLRSSIIKQVCGLLVEMAASAGNQFDDSVAYLLPTLFKLLYVSIKVIAQSGDQCIRGILEHTHSPKLLQPMFQGSKDSHSVVRKSCCDYLALYLNQAPATEVVSEQNLRELEEVCVELTQDADAATRVSARALYEAFCVKYVARGKALWDRLSAQTQKTLTQERKKVASKGGAAAPNKRRRSKC